MTSTTETVNALFEYAISLERSAETLYRSIGQLFAAHDDLVAFWNNIADEEKGHAMYLERVRDGLQAERLNTPANDVILEHAKNCLRESSEITLEDIHTLQDAYELAVELENSETNTIFEFVITTFSTEELAKSHKFLRTQLQDHVAKLEKEFPSRFMSRIARQEVKAEHLF